jgi:hypothetical protein
MIMQTGGLKSHRGKRHAADFCRIFKVTKEHADMM